MNFISYFIKARERNDYPPSTDILSASCTDLYRFVLTKGDKNFNSSFGLVLKKDRTGKNFISIFPKKDYHFAETYLSITKHATKGHIF